MVDANERSLINTHRLDTYVEQVGPYGRIN